eukprot:Nk52_evm1s1972 gene=Nk52_evmTU1s1972
MTSSNDFKAQDLSATFVKQYYTVMHSQPEMLHRFYGKDSASSRPSYGDVHSEITKGEAAIEKLFKQVDLRNCLINVDTLDAQPSLNGGVFVVTYGTFFREGEQARKFAQSFLLAPQNKGFYIANDVLRFLEPLVLLDSNGNPAQANKAENKKQVSAGAASATSSSATSGSAGKNQEKKKSEESSKKAANKQEQAVNGVKSNEVSPKSNNTSSMMNGGESANSGSGKKQRRNKASTDASAAETADAQATNAPVEGAAVENQPMKPKSWANIAKSGEPVTSPTQQQTGGKKNRNSNNNNNNNNNASVDGSAGNGNARGGAQQQQTSKPVCTVVLKPIPAELNVDMVKKHFQPFGKIKNVNLNQQRGICFVDFESADSVKKVVPNGSARVAINGMEMPVEQRKEKGSYGNNNNNGNNTGKRNRKGAQQQ